jgi:polar amino acid transport system ATP-binding protein
VAALEVRGLEVTRGKQVVLRGVDLDVAPGEVCALMGASGAGKSTTLRAIAALESFTAGRIAVGEVVLNPGRVPPETELRALRRVLGMVFQGHALFDHLTVLENVVLAPVHALGWTLERATHAAHELLASLGVDHRADAHPRDISGGEAQRVAIARALALDPVLLLMDEPTSALDPARRGALATTLRELAQSGRALLVSTHDTDFAGACADRVVMLRDGRVAEHGRAVDVLRTT